ncbi:PDZ domain-containing protein [Sulfurimonas sp.]|uniref:DUF7488 domain-containing protein n=1 Tax=Sulfurimonas sp. TaxID=2022749 RepID=UPI00286DBE3E|nr:PDZ domain-containing protein [Sulfurimonas sp.]
MFRLFLALNLLFLNLYACKGDSELCKLKTVDSKSIVNQTLQIPLPNNQKLIFSTTAPDAKIIKHDPYLSLYLVEETNNFKYPFRINMNPASALFGVDNKRIVKGKILKREVGLESFATFSEPLSVPSLLLNSCCALEGIVTPLGIIEKEYIDRFLKIKKVSYGDFGIRIKDLNSTVVVSSSNPFKKDNPFKKNDIILEIDGKKAKDSAMLMREILFSNIGSEHTLKIKRENKIVVLKAITQNRLGGGYLSNTFLEFLGVSFDKNLVIVKIDKDANKYGLKIGDKLLQVNTKDIKNEEEIYDVLDNPKESINLLFQRDNFQFFVKVN